MKLTYEAPFLRHFTAHLEPVEAPVRLTGRHLSQGILRDGATPYAVYVERRYDDETCAADAPHHAIESSSSTAIIPCEVTQYKHHTPSTRASMLVRQSENPMPMSVANNSNPRRRTSARTPIRK